VAGTSLLFRPGGMDEHIKAFNELVK
jgi:hypothetical protein